MTLEAAGLIERRHDPDDRRLRRVYITPAGTDARPGAPPGDRDRGAHGHGLNDRQRHDFNSWLVRAAAQASSATAS